MSIGLDTSVVLRLLTGVPAKQADAARRMLAASRDTVCVSDLVVSESYFGLRHHYAVPHAEAAHALAALLDDPRVQCTGVARRVLLDATAGALSATPEAAVIHPSATTSLVAGTATEVRVRVGRHAFTIDEPPVLGGTDHGANPVEHLLASLGSCQVITYQVWAAKLGIAFAKGGNQEVRGYTTTGQS